MADHAKLPEVYDFSAGSSNTYRIEERHRFPKCFHCGRWVDIIVDGNGWWAYTQKNKLVQQAFPNMSADGRELLLSGTHPECWDAMMGPEPT